MSQMIERCPRGSPRKYRACVMALMPCGNVNDFRGRRQHQAHSKYDLMMAAQRTL